PDGALLRLGSLRFKHPNSAHDLALSPDGKIVITAGNRQYIAWDAATGKQLWAKSQPSSAIMSGSFAGENVLAFTPDGQRLITPVRGNAIAVWEIKMGQHEVLTLKGIRALPEAQISAVDVAADGKSLAIGNGDAVYLTDFDGNVRKKIPNENTVPRDQNDRLLFHIMMQAGYSFARFSPDGKTLAVTSNQAKILRLYDPASGEERKQIELTA